MTWTAPQERLNEDVVRVRLSRPKTERSTLSEERPGSLFHQRSINYSGGQNSLLRRKNNNLRTNRRHYSHKHVNNYGETHLDRSLPHHD